MKSHKYRSLLRINCRGTSSGLDEKRIILFWMDILRSAHVIIAIVTCEWAKIFIFIFAIYWLALLNYKHRYYTRKYSYTNANMLYLHGEKRASIENHFNLRDQFKRSRLESLCCFQTRVYSCIFCVYFIAQCDSAVFFFQSNEIANVFTKQISHIYE